MKNPFSIEIKNEFNNLKKTEVYLKHDNVRVGEIVLCEDDLYIIFISQPMIPFRDYKFLDRCLTNMKENVLNVLIK